MFIHQVLNLKLLKIVIFVEHRYVNWSKNFEISFVWVSAQVVSASPYRLYIK